MPIQKWHVGKIVLLWAWGVILSLVVIRVIIGTERALPGFILVFVLLAILIALSVITWRWLGGKEQ